MDEDIERQITQAERFHDRIARGFLHTKQGQIIVAKDFDAIDYLDDVIDITKRLNLSDERVSILIKSAKGMPSIRFSKLGLGLFLACQQYKSKICERVDGDLVPLYAGRTLHPCLAIALPLISKYEAQIGCAVEADHERLDSLVRNLVDEIRACCGELDLQARLENYTRNARAKFARALKYIISLFEMRSRLLILRVDIYLRGNQCEDGYAEAADAAFEYFANALSRNEIVPDVMGWMAAREDGLERGRHYHILVALDGHLHHAGANLAKLVGEFWERDCVMSAGTGSYFNCFALVDRYKHLGIGMVRRDDAAKLLGLRYAIQYFFKEEVMLMPNSSLPRNFRRGQIDNEYVRRGAPRKNDDGLALAREVLLGPRPRKKPLKISARDLEYRHRCRL